MLKNTIVLDLNGLLIDRKKYKIPGRNYDAIVNNNYVYIRPHAREFCGWLMNNFNVGIWSSMMKHNCSKILQIILTKKQNKKLKFVFDQSDCEPLYNNAGEDINDFDDEYVNTSTQTRAQMRTRTRGRPILTKPIHKIIDAYEDISINNILLIDDSYEKVIFNPDYTCMCVESWNAEHDLHNTDTFLAKNSDFRYLLSELRKENSIPVYLSKNTVI